MKGMGVRSWLVNRRRLYGKKYVKRHFQYPSRSVRQSTRDPPPTWPGCRRCAPASGRSFCPEVPCDMTYLWMMKYRKETKTYNGLTEKQWFAAAFEGRHPWKCRSYEERLARQERFERKARQLQAKRDAKVQQEELLALQTRRAQNNPDHIRSRLRPDNGGAGVGLRGT